MAGAGFAAVIVGHRLDPRPIDADAAEALAREYDRGLRTSLGISDLASLPR